MSRKIDTFGKEICFYPNPSDVFPRNKVVYKIKREKIDLKLIISYSIEPVF